MCGCALSVMVLTLLLQKQSRELSAWPFLLVLQHNAMLAQQQLHCVVVGVEGLLVWCPVLGEVICD